jgi:hypothetical protein
MPQVGRVSECDATVAEGVSFVYCQSAEVAEILECRMLIWSRSIQSITCSPLSPGNVVWTPLL